MKTTTVATAVATFCAAGALAAPNVAGRRVSNWRSVERANRRGNVRLPADSIASVNGNNNVTTSTNWAGAVINDSGFASVVGTITVPTPKDVETYNGFSVWVGIDGNTCTSAILQTGIQITINSLGTVTYDPWYEWYPDFPYDFTGISISAGDEIRMSVTASSPSAGVATLENLSTGVNVSHSFANQTHELCQTDAEWIVEDFALGPYLAPFAQFGSVTFTGASATQNGEAVDVSDATILNIKQNNQTLTSCSVTNNTTVDCDRL
ncbi:peptidase A4 family-domain-containing protein [Xylaria intraflava]|nr:peptidase A4 family-domain-containing protein [Xylaria intraflava]